MEKGRMWNLKAVFALLIMASFVLASVEHTYTDIDFNVDSALAFTVTLPGESAVTSAPAGAATTGIEFNASNGDQQYVNCSVQAAGSTAQTATVPCFNISNSGTVDFQLNITINATMPAAACDMNLSIAVGDDMTGSPSVWYTIGTANQTINASLGIGSYNEWWLYTNFSGCGVSDNTERRLFIWGYNSTT